MMKTVKVNLRKWLYMHRYYLGVFFLALIPRLIVVMGAFPLRTVTDELITTAGGAYFAGLNWSEVLAFSERYYGSGFTMLFWWVFKMTDNPIVIYRIMLTGCAMLQASVGGICFYILERHFGMENKMYNSLLSIACSYCVVTRATIVYNEHMLVFLSWCIALLLVKLSDSPSKRQRRVYTGILSLFMLYSLTIHTRAYTFWLALIVVCVLYFWIYNKGFVSKIVAIGSVGAAGIVLYLIEILKANMYLLESGQDLYNTTVSVSGIRYLSYVESWQVWLNIIIGQINTISVFSGGFMILGVILCMSFLYRAIFKRRSLSGNVESSSEEYMIGKYFAIIIFFSAAIAMTILAQSFSWLGSVTKDVMGQGDGTMYYLKAFTYVRYFGPYCGPIVMVIGSYVYNFRNQFQKYLKPAIWLMTTIQIYWIFVILPLINGNPYVTEVFLPFFAGKYAQAPRLRSFLIPATILMLVFIIIIICYLRKKILLPVILLAILFVYQYGYNAVVFDGAFDKSENYIASEKSYNWIKKMETQVKLPKEIYVYDGREIENQQIFYEYQFLLNRYLVIPGLPSAGVSEAVILSNTEAVSQQLAELGEYTYIKLSEDQFIFVKGEKMKREFGGNILMKECVKTE